MSKIDELSETVKRLEKINKTVRLDFEKGHARFKIRNGDPVLYIGYGETMMLINGVELNLGAAQELRNWLNKVFSDEKE